MPPTDDILLWLRPEEVKPSDVLTISSSHRKTKIPTKDGDKDVWEVDVVTSNDKRRAWTLSKTNYIALATKLGENSDAWIGKKVNVFKVMQNVMGSFKEVIYVEGVGRKPSIEILEGQPPSK